MGRPLGEEGEEVVSSSGVLISGRKGHLVRGGHITVAINIINHQQARQIGGGYVSAIDTAR